MLQRKGEEKSPRDMNERRCVDWIKNRSKHLFLRAGCGDCGEKKQKTKNKTTKYAQTGVAAVAEAAPAVFSSVSLTRMPPVQVLPEFSTTFIIESD